jgi:hypothetical protein
VEFDKVDRCCREAPDAERAALALTGTTTRLADRADAVPDDIWAEAAMHYDEQQLAALVIAIASTNTWNRLNVATRAVAGALGRPTGTGSRWAIGGRHRADGDLSPHGRRPPRIDSRPRL